MTQQTTSHPQLAWANTSGFRSLSFQCGYCGNRIASGNGYFAQAAGSGTGAHIVVCHFCTRPTFFDHDGSQLPGVSFGGPVQGIPDASTLALYEEARRSTSANCYTAAVLCCRKLLMHVAVQKGAAPGLAFVKYVEHLADNNFVPPDAKGWVDHIRKKSNEANHEIVMMDKSDAEELLTFSEMLLKVIYEFPAAIQGKLKKSK